VFERLTSVTFSAYSVGWRYRVPGLRKYAEGLPKELVEMTETLPWVN
jgi:hypothetical protein